MVGLPAAAPRSSAALRRRPRPRPRPWVLAALLYVVVGLLVAPHDLTRLTGHSFEGGISDSGLMEWWLAWVPHALAHGHSPLHSAALFAPNGVSALENSSLVVPALLLAPVTETLGPAASFTLLCWVSLPLTALSGYAWLRRHVPPVGAVAGGLVLGFNPAMTRTEVLHPFLTALALLPLLLIVLERVLAAEGRWWVNGLALGVLLPLQVLTGAEAGVLFVIGVAVAALVLALQRPRLVPAVARRALPPVAVGGAVALVLLAYPLTQLRGRYRIVGPIQPVDLFVSRPGDLLRGTSDLLGGRLPLTTSATGAQAGGSYLGPLLIAVLVIAVVVLVRDLVARTAVVTGLVATALSWGGHGAAFHPWGPVQRTVPLMDNVLPFRFTLVSWAAVAVLVALLVARLGRARLPWRVAGTVLVALALLSVGPRPTPGPTPTTATPTFFRDGLPGLPADALLVVGPDPLFLQDVAMRWQVESGFRFRLVGGYMAHPVPGSRHASFFNQSPASAAFDPPSGFLGATEPAYRPLPAPDELQQARDDLTARGVCAVVVGPSPDRDHEVAVAQQLFGRSADAVTGGVDLWYAACRPTP